MLQDNNNKSIFSVLSRGPCTDKLAEGNSKYAGFCIVSLLRAQNSLPPAIEECNKYDQTCAVFFLLATHNDRSRWFAISSLLPICSFRFVGGVGKKST